MSTSTTSDDVTRALTGSPDAPTITLERHYRTGPADLWQAVTDPVRLARWFGTLSSTPSGPGEEFEVVLDDTPGAAPARARLTACETGRHLAYDWEYAGVPSRVRVDLVPDSAGDPGTTLRLTHARLSPAQVIGYGGGWEDGLAVLAAQLGIEGAAEPDEAERVATEEAAQGAWSLITAGPLSMERDLPGDLDTIWRAFSTVEGLRAWWWNHWDDVEIAFEASPGARYRFGVESAGVDLTGTVLEVEPREHLSYTWEWTDADGTATHEAVDLRFTPIDGGTRVRVRQSGPWDDDGTAAENYRQGWDFTLDQLVAVLRG